MDTFLIQCVDNSQITMTITLKIYTTVLNGRENDQGVAKVSKSCAPLCAAAGAIETPINNALMNHPKKIAALLGNIPAQHLVQPYDVGGAVSFLASDNTSYMIGTTLFFDGDLLWNYREQ